MFEKPLSPTTQAVSNAANEAFWDWGDMRPSSNNIAAAAIRAVADQVVPHIEEPDWGACDHMQCDIELYTDHQRKRAALLAIATELESHQ